ncbi:MAG: WD40 repeat domain-containing protein [Thermoguttaceae bacterium]|nr:WD40 repeat domain-containing protein [Thermoguttaceae bacterium]
MSSEFDPYRIWLGIPVSEQPANLYRLLGLALFESDDDVISNAADRQMAHVRTFQTGKYSEQSQKLLNELSAARVTLLDKKKKAEYDAKLKSELDSSGGSSMVNLGNAAPPQGSFIGGQSSVNLAPPPPINAPEGSLLGVNLGLSSTSKKKAGASEKSVRDKSGKGASTTSYSGGKRAGSKKNNNVGVIAGVIAAAAALLIVGLIFMNSSSKNESEEPLGPDDYTQSEYFQKRAQLSQAPQPQQQAQSRPDRPKPSDKRNREDKRKNKKDKAAETNNENDFALPPAVGDAPVVPELPASDAGTKKADAESPENAAGEGADVPVDVTQLAQTPGQVKVYEQVQAKTIAPSTLLTDVESAPVSALHQSADSSHLLVGSPDAGKASVVNVSTGSVALSLAPSTVGRFADCNATRDEKMYFLAVNPSKPTLMQYQADLLSDALAAQADPTDFRPQSFVFRFDANGQPVKETDSQFGSFVKFKGYQILHIAAPASADTGLMAVALTDGLIHVINVESGADFMRFYPSDSAAPIPVWTNDSIETAKKEKDKFKDLFKVIKPSVVPTAMVFQSEKYLATGNSQGEAFVWNVEEYAPVVDTVIPSLQQLTHEFAAKESNSAVINMRFDSTGQKLYIFWADGHVGMWDWKNKQLVKKGFVEQKVKYAQILANKYLLVQNVKGEVSIWSWDTEKVNQIGIFKRLTDLVIADPDNLLFWASEQGASGSNLTMYALPTDFVEAMKTPEFAKLFKTIIIYSVPEESQWKAKMAEAESIVEKHLKDLTDDQKKVKIREFVNKMQDSSSIEPNLRYALYMTFIQTMAQLKDKDQTLNLVGDVLKEFDADKNDLKLNAYMALLPQLKKNEALVIAKETLDLCESMLNNGGNKERIKEIARAVKKTCPEFEKRANVLIFKCNN